MSDWVIMTAHNCLPLTKKAVASVLAMDGPDIQLWLINNESSDGTVWWANSVKHDNFRVTHNYPEPASLAATWNQALNYVLNKLGEAHALVVNNDIEVRPDAYKLLLADPGGFVTCVGVSPADWALVPQELPTPLRRSPHPDFSCFLIRRWAWNKVGPFNEAYIGAYAEDAEYHIRMHQAGVEAVSLDLPYLHHAAQTIKRAPPWEQQTLEENARRNRERFFKTYGVRIGTPEYDKLFQGGVQDG